MYSKTMMVMLMLMSLVLYQYVVWVTDLVDKRCKMVSNTRLYVIEGAQPNAQHH